MTTLSLESTSSSTIRVSLTSTSGVSGASAYRLSALSDVAGILKNADVLPVSKKNEAIDAEAAFQAYIGILSSPASGFEEFSRKVNHYIQLPPFRLENPVNEFGGQRRVSERFIKT